MTDTPVRLSVVIPAYNEAARICDTLMKLTDYFAYQDYTVEIIVVDDGSPDGTAKVVAERFPDIMVLSYTPNRGKGYAVRHGMGVATGAYRLFYDADGSTPIEEVEKLWPRFEEGAAIVIGSRALPESNIEVLQPPYRRIMGRVYNLLLRFLFLTTFPDTQCGFKCMTAESCGAIFRLQKANGFGSDCEILYIAQCKALTVAQVPVRWTDSPDTRVRAIYDSLNMMREVCTIRLRSFTGAYR